MPIITEKHAKVFEGMRKRFMPNAFFATNANALWDMQKVIRALVSGTLATYNSATSRVLSNKDCADLYFLTMKMMARASVSDRESMEERVDASYKMFCILSKYPPASMLAHPPHTEKPNG